MLFRRNGSGNVPLSLHTPPENEPPAARRSRPGQTIIGSQTRIRGTLSGSGPMLVRGSVEGEITLDGDLIVTPEGAVDADAAVQCLDLLGHAKGSMKVSDRVLIGPTGTFEGDIATPVLDMHPGSILRGKASIAGLTPVRRDD